MPDARALDLDLVQKTDVEVAVKAHVGAGKDDREEDTDRLDADFAERGCKRMAKFVLQSIA